MKQSHTDWPCVDTKTCSHCGTTDQRGQWWSLRNYYSLSGWFCPKCFDLVEHRSPSPGAWGRPVNPEGYAAVLVGRRLE